ncbi:MAG TPA: hypothetical protein VH437_16150 [Terriglobales bacterium]|jgi:hypothetical protein
MGVTIHFEGQLLGEDAFRSLIATANAFATTHQWLTQPIESAQTTLLRVRDNEEEWNYSGPARGVVLYPSEDCDPVRLEFDTDLYVQEFVKTQFAGPKTHVAVVELLRTLKPFFGRFSVEDEGGYWDSGSVQTLAKHLEAAQDAIEAELRKDPSAQSKVKTSDGRIMDLMS